MSETLCKSAQCWVDRYSTASQWNSHVHTSSVICAIWCVGPPSPQTPSSESFLSALGRLEESDHTGCWLCPETSFVWGRRASGTCCLQKETAGTEAKKIPISSDPRVFSSLEILKEHFKDIHKLHPQGQGEEEALVINMTLLLFKRFISTENEF